MTPAQFLGRIKRNEIPPVCLFLGQEGYNRRRCREALVAAASGVESEQHDLSTTSLAAVIDDARSMSLFASERLIFVIGAETAMPRSARGATAGEDDDDDGGSSSPGSLGVLEAYVKSPTPGVTLIFEATRWDLDGEDKAKSERARKFYSAIPDIVEFRAFSSDEARQELDRIARAAGVRLDPAAAETLVEALAADVARIAVEIEKLSLYGKPVTVDDLALLVPDARQSTIFALVNALGRRDRIRALATLDALVREGEYLPLALSFLATQFRMALVAKEANLRGASQVQSHFQRVGVQMWGSRAEQIAQTATKFSKEQLERGLKLLFETDRDLRSARPDDRTIVENFVIALCR
ncbi:MAG TPA: DNA polymerase III subunit delta [Bryobacteraceae bacterium]|jgi:DNA polymerase-3 subunit delta|nr:DNA polymerase III subunit delta [Bryobacteraceae bacterium]